MFPPAGNRGDLTAHYFRNRGLIYLSLALSERRISSSPPPISARSCTRPTPFHLLFTALSAMLTVSGSHKLHKLLLGVILILAAIFVTAFSLRLD